MLHLCPFTYHPLETEDGDVAMESKVMNNYLSFGFDAEIVTRFHQLRERYPDKFGGQLSNKTVYARFSHDS